MAEKTQCNCRTCSCNDLTWNASGMCTPCGKGIHYIDEAATQ